MALSSSDWITIAGTLAQVLTAICVGIWQVRRTFTPKNKNESPLSSNKRFDWKFYFQESWQYFFCTFCAVLALWWTLSSSEPLSRSFVVQVVAFSFLLVFGLFGTTAMLLVTAMRPVFLKIAELGESKPIREIVEDKKL